MLVHLRYLRIRTRVPGDPRAERGFRSLSRPQTRPDGRPLGILAAHAIWRLQAATCHALPPPIRTGSGLPCASRPSGRLPGVQVLRAAGRGLARVARARLWLNRRPQPSLRTAQKRMGSIRAREGELCMDRVHAQGLRRTRGLAGRGSRRSATVGDQAVLGSICGFYLRPTRGGDVHVKGGASWRRSRTVSRARPLLALAYAGACWASEHEIRNGGRTGGLGFNL